MALLCDMPGRSLDGSGLDISIDKKGAVAFAVRAVPRASGSEVIGIHEGALKVRLGSPPVDGAANKELIACLSKFFKVSKSSISIVSGQLSRNKRVSMAGITPEKVMATADKLSKR